MSIISTKISNGYQTVVPSEIRKKYNIEPHDIIEWNMTDKGIKISFRKKTHFKDIMGIAESDEITDAVKLKKELYLKDEEK